MQLQLILHVWIHQDNDLVDLTITHVTHTKGVKPSSEVIHTNKKHPFLTVEKGFLPVGQIKLGMHVVEADGQLGVISGWKVVPGVKTMYNLEVAQDHTFVVGMWVVHDCNSLNPREQYVYDNLDTLVPGHGGEENMGKYLYVGIETPMNVNTNYWYPLIFEAMDRISFSFSRPGNSEKRGILFSAAQGDDIECTFRELWDILYTQRDKGLISFWPSKQLLHPFHMRASLDVHAQNYAIGASIENGYFHLLGDQEIQERIDTLVQFGLELYQLCIPCSIVMYWDDIPIQLMHMGSSLERDPGELIEFGDHQLSWKKKACIGDHCIYVVHPMPIYINFKAWRFVPTF
jgi:Pretoxin HINT domain